MSDDNKTETAKGGSGTKRPHATLDLKADRVEEPDGENGQPAETTAASHNDNTPQPARKGGGTTGFLTHMAAGLFGGLIALVIGYYALGNFRDRLPFVSDTSAEQMRQAQAELEARVSAQAEQDSAARAELSERISALDSRTEGLARTDDAAVEALRTRVETLAQQIEANPPGPDETVSPERVTSLSERLDSLANDLASVRSDLDAVQQQTSENVAAARASALAVAVRNLGEAVDRGESFAGELEAVRELSSEPLEAETLAGAAEDGVPTMQALRESFPSFANNALEAVGATSDDSLIGQIVESARSVVNVRPVGEIEGDSPAAIMARVENRLKAGDLPGVVEQSDQLSGEAAVQLLPWIERVKTRIAATEELDALEARTLAAIKG